MKMSVNLLMKHIGLPKVVTIVVAMMAESKIVVRESVATEIKVPEIEVVPVIELTEMEVVKEVDVTEKKLVIVKEGVTVKEVVTMKEVVTEKEVVTQKEVVTVKEVVTEKEVVIEIELTEIEVIDRGVTVIVATEIGAIEIEVTEETGIRVLM